MSRINHSRPELPYRDNLRQELRRIAGIWPDKSDPVDAPAILKPFATRLLALPSLGKVLEAFTEYLEEPRDVYSLTPPADAIALRKACQEFGNARMSNPYDRLYSVHDWLKEAVADQATTNTFYEWLLQIVEAS